VLAAPPRVQLRFKRLLGTVGFIPVSGIEDHICSCEGNRRSMRPVKGAPLRGPADAGP
jgi:hypothetical protein